MPAKLKSPTTRAWRPDPLPRGRHGLSSREVRASQRSRVLRSMLELVARQGYAGTSVPQVAAAARVSRNAFYEHFADKEACFLALCEEEAAQLSEIVAAASAREKGWVAAVRAGIRATLGWWRERPQFARAYFAELPTAGHNALAQRLRAYEPFEEMFRQIATWSRHGSRNTKPLAPRMPRLLIVAITEMIAVEVREGRIERLADLEGDLVRTSVLLLRS